MNENNKWFVIVNPKAGSGTGNKDWPIIQSHLLEKGVSFDFALTQRKYHAVELAVSAINQGYKKILSIGGNGTINEIVNGIFIQTTTPPSDILIGIINVGLAKGYNQMAPKPDFYHTKVVAVKDEKYILQDMGMVQFFESRINHTRYFFNSASVGFHAELAHRFNTQHENGRKSRSHYKLSMLKAISRYRSSMVKLRIDEMELNGILFSILIHVGVCYAGQQLKVDTTNCNDGFLHVGITKKVRRWLAVWKLNRFLYDQTHDCRSYKGTRITISAKPHVTLELDGEALGSSPIAFTILPKSIKVLIG